MITGIIMEMVAIMTGGLTETMVLMLKKTQTQVVIPIMWAGPKLENGLDILLKT